MSDPTAVLYCRVSTVRQAEEELPIASQRERCEDKARALGAVVLRVYCDEGLSGQSDDRPAFQAAILYCEAHSPTYLITWSTSRFARNRLDAQLYKRRLGKTGTSLVYAGMDIDRETDGGWLTEGILELFDEFASRQIAADTRRSMIRAAKNGFWGGGHPPYGYRSVPAHDDPKRRRLEVVTEESALVERIFKMRADGIGAKTIAKTLTNSGYGNRFRKWSKTTVLSLLRNQAMIGNVVFGRSVTINGAHRRADPADWIIVPAHQPIIERPLWDAVQRLLDTDAVNTRSDSDAPGGSPHSTHLFTGLLRCGRCGASLQIETAKGRSKRYSYYNCRSAQRSGDCLSRRLPSRELDGWLVDVLDSDVLHPDNLRMVAHDLRERAGRWHEDRAQRRRTVEMQIQTIARRNGKLYEVLEEYGRDAPNLGDLAGRLRDNNQQIKKLQAEAQTIDAEIPPRVRIVDDDLVDLHNLLVEIMKDEYNPARARDFFSGFVNEISVKVDHVTIQYDPNLLLETAVPSNKNWLPSPALLGTLTVRADLPKRLLVAGRRR